ncbi:putative oxidoreductase [Pseudonocardia thermophila]|jgi:Predicted membrane protein|uniref:Putative oxidoreductase n=1 Tax=Pseudonocardia thermophila TaxID=1848 RepID=A0A1M6QI89_PSETH|nr:DoxX family protein [Pseudonocardia thermophila]SHK20034.1 putative oxidoreductase [Pseudonocardia thermophila]
MTDSTSTIPDFSQGFGASDSTATTRPTRRALAWNPATDVGLLILRFVVGGIVFAHGMQKVFGMWGYPGIGEFTRSVTAAGYQQPVALAWATGIAEVVAGAFVVLGLITPLAAAAILAIKINAVALAVGAGAALLPQMAPVAVEGDVVLGAAAAALVLTGPGHIALDNGRTWHRRPAPWGVLALIIGVAVGVLVYVLMRGSVAG